MRDKDGKTSSLWNTNAFGEGITKIELQYASTMEVKYDNPDAVVFSFGNAVNNYTYITKLSTTKGTKSYTITPNSSSYSYLHIEHDLGYSMYWDSIKIYYGGDVVRFVEDTEISRTEVKKKVIYSIIFQNFN